LVAADSLHRVGGTDIIMAECVKSNKEYILRNQASPVHSAACHVISGLNDSMNQWIVSVHAEIGSRDATLKLFPMWLRGQDVFGTRR